MFPQDQPYRLYSVSSAGSLVGFATYPLFVEPFIGIDNQFRIWSLVFLLFVAVVLSCAVPALVARLVRDPRGITAEHPSAASSVHCVLWTLLSAVGCVLLLGTTSELSEELAAIPFVWVPPLIVYLLTMVISFSKDSFYRREYWIISFLVPLTVGAANEMGYVVLGKIELAGMRLLNLLFGCMLCHGELVRLKPPAGRLTSFYICCAGGGALASIFVVVIGPLVFVSYLELPLALQASVLCSVIVAMREKGWRLGASRGQTVAPAALLTCLTVGAGVLAVAWSSPEGSLYASRGFFGIVRVGIVEGGVPDRARRTLYHGNIVHGSQYVSDERSRAPITYYSPNSGAGTVLSSYKMGESREIGVIGLGVGTLAAYGGPKDRMTFYEVNPQIVAAAQEQFSYLRNSAAKIQIVLGDGRLSLAKGKEKAFDILVLDAFNGGAIPTHLMTKEAFGVYLDRLQCDGVVVVHVSNSLLDFVPVVSGIARQFGLDMVVVGSPLDGMAGAGEAKYVILTRGHGRSGGRWLRDKGIGVYGWSSSEVMWTDDYSSLLRVLK